ncbi:AraC family transcriptional regulator (plasmid) [Streptomyces sp. BI20]|uniref:AraC family transcriptional regulator n=1 Tax=Streptomyces sp. BI20 TaxID=3403460 RepID=UPI003C75B656
MPAPRSVPLSRSIDRTDPVAQTLELVDARCSLACGFTAGGNWALAFPAPGRLKVQAVLKGRVWLVVEGVERPVCLTAGDFAVLSGRRRHTLGSDPALPAVDAPPPIRATSENLPHIGDAAREVVTVGGHLDVNDTGRELLSSALPPLLHVRAATAEAPAACWLMERTLHEMGSTAPGATVAAEHLARLLLLQVLRASLDHADTAGAPTRRLRALADERVAPALSLMHGDPAHPWTLAELARAATMSRTGFAQRFKEVVGVPPLAYLYAWRMRPAERTLSARDTPIAVIASSLGYSSESAFSNAFKRATGLAPRRYREAARAG